MMIQRTLKSVNIAFQIAVKALESQDSSQKRNIESTPIFNGQLALRRSVRGTVSWKHSIAANCITELAH